jgi:hypothetical protein
MDRNKIKSRDIVNGKHRKVANKNNTNKTDEIHGQCQQKGGIEQLSITGKIECRNSRGRQRETYVERLYMWRISKDMNNNELMIMNASNKRDGWRTNAVNDCSRQDTP